MKIKKDFTLHQSATMNIVVKKSEEKALFSLNETGAVLFKALEMGTNERGLLKALQAEYEVEEKEAIADIKEFLKRLEVCDILER
jgi:hypothetical protein